MTPFEEFRLWLREGALYERTLALVASVIALGLVAWVLVPSDETNDDGDQVATGPAAESTQPTTAGQAPASGSQGEAPSATPGGSVGPAPSAGTRSQSPGASNGPAAPTPGSTEGAACPPGSTDPGVTASGISIGITLLDIAGGNSAIGIPPPEEQRREHQAFVDAVNAKGGLLCRKIVPKYYTDNPLDSGSEHALCIQIVNDKPFAVIGGLYQAENATCLPQNKIPSYLQTGRPTTEMKKFVPYLFSFYADSETMYRALAIGAKEQGFFDGMNKLGVVTFDCFTEYEPQLMGALGRVGVPSNKIETFNYGCPPGQILVPPSTVAQAVFQFQRDGVDRVMSAGPNLSSFTSQAQSQGFHPQYAVSDIDTTMTLSPSTGFKPDAQNFDGALDISNGGYGATTTPGVPMGPETAKCDEIMVKGHADWKSTDGDGYAGGVCNQWQMLVMGATNAGNLKRNTLALGLSKVGYYWQSYPGAPVLWNDPNDTMAGPYWRPIRYVGANNTWKVVNAEYSTALG